MALTVRREALTTLWDSFREFEDRFDRLGQLWRSAVPGGGGLAPDAWVPSVEQHHRAAWVLPGDVETPRTARHHVGEKLAEWGVPPASIGDAQLVTTELITNALRHTSSTRIRVELVLTGSEIEVAVIDRGPHRPLTLRTPGGRLEGGRGLVLVDALTSRWGHRRRGEGTEVWAVLQTPHAGPP
jgi:anti-sigma regulatory factor (Ser/Thr protein kinase)